MPNSLVLPQRPAFARSFPKDDGLVAVSTYQLDQEQSIRDGTICIVKVERNKDELSLELKDTVKTTAGVFRFEWRNDETVISALTDGTLSINRLSDSFKSESIPVSSNLLLDVSQSDSSLTGTTDNKGNAYIVDVDTSTVVSMWSAHSLKYSSDDKCEVWTCALTKDHNLMATGADDALLKIWDTRSRTAVGHFKVFDAGVTFVEWTSEDLLLTGSYDEHIRILDRRQPKQSIKEVKLKGGVWNLEHVMSSSGQVRTVAACMYGGYAVVDADLNVIKENEKAGEQLLYGATFVDGASEILYTTFNNYTVAV